MNIKIAIAVSILAITSMILIIVPVTANLVGQTYNFGAGMATPTPAPTPTPSPSPSPAPVAVPETIQPDAITVPLTFDPVTGFPLDSPAFQQFNQLNSGSIEEIIASNVSPVSVLNYEFLPSNEDAYNFDTSAFDDMISALINGLG